MKLFKLNENLFTEECHGNIGDVDLTDYKLLEEHAIGYCLKSESSVKIMFDFDGELCWFSYSKQNTKMLYLEFC